MGVQEEEKRRNTDIMYTLVCVSVLCVCVCVCVYIYIYIYIYIRMYIIYKLINKYFVTCVRFPWFSYVSTAITMG
jgi:hypothetical protein